MRDRSFLRVFLILTVLGIPAGSVRASDHETQGPSGFERERVYGVPVQPSEGTGFEVDRVIVDTGSRHLGVSAGAGVVRESQDRIRLRGVPVVGQVFMDRLAQSDFSADRAVGKVYLDDDTLWVHLASGQRSPRFDTVVVVHDRFSYRFQGQLAASSAEPAAKMRVVGEAYARKDALLILIRPSIITDSVLNF